MNAETLRKWVRQAEVDAGGAPGVTIDAVREIRELPRKMPPARIDDRNSQGCNEFLRAGVRPATPLICPFIIEHRDRFGVVPI